MGRRREGENGPVFAALLLVHSVLFIIALGISNGLTFNQGGLLFYTEVRVIISFLLFFMLLYFHCSKIKQCRLRAIRQSNPLLRPRPLPLSLPLPMLLKLRA
jgi:hypothetical protein